MTTLTTPPSTVSHRDEGYLNAGISSSATTLTVAPIYKWINGVKTKQGFDSTAGLIEVTQGDKFERMSFSSASVDSTTKVTTLSGLTRGMSVTSTTSTYSGGTGMTWNKGARVAVVVDEAYLQDAAYTTKANTFTPKQTFSVPPRMAVYATSGDLPAGGNGDEGAYVTADGVFYDYIAGAWSQRATGTTPNGSTTVAGKFEEATVAEQGTATATGGTGARLVPAVANLVKTSSGAGDENKIPVLNSSGVLAQNFVATGTANSTKYARGDGTWATLATAVLGLTESKNTILTSGDKTTTNTAFEDLDGTNASVTIGTTTTNTILFIYVSGITSSSSATGVVYFDFSVGGTRLGGTNGLTAFYGNNPAGCSSFAIKKPGAGSNIVVKAQWRTTTGTATLKADSSSPLQFYVYSFELGS